MFFNYRFLTLVAAMGCMFFLTFPAMGQDPYQGQQQGQMGTTQEQPPVNNAKLEKAATAYVGVIEINQEFQQSIQGVEDKDQRLELQEDANNKMIAAIEDAGLDVESYSRIIAQVRSDEGTREQFLEKVEQKK